MDVRSRMDRMYGLQRHFYDLTRERYLLGRDAALARLAPKPGEQILEIGCGTARNLLRLSRMEPRAELYGLDASSMMLCTAERKIARAGRPADIRLACALAENFSWRATYRLTRAFDAMLFSYSLSMIPSWPQALETALENLRPGGRIVIVDFWDQGEWPALFRDGLARWLALFGVHHRPELLARLRALEEAGRIGLELASVRRRYAFIATLVRPACPVHAQVAAQMERLESA